MTGMRSRMSCWVCMSSVLIVSVGTVVFGRLFERFERAQVEREVRAFIASWNSAVARRDNDAVRAAYSVDDAFAWFEDGRIRYTSSGQIIAALNDFPIGTTIQTELSEIEVRVMAADLAYVSAFFETKLELPSGPIEFVGVFTSLVERSNGGGWVFAGGHSSSRDGP